MTSPDTLIGRTLGERYRIVRRLGEGGMGYVYEAEHLKLGRSVAIKVLHDEHAASPEFRQRFEREAKVLSMLSHPNIVTVVDFGFDGARPFLVMDLLRGSELDIVLASGPLPAERAFSIARQIVRAVAHAHRQGLIHRDLKPQNIMVRVLADGSDHVTVLDFGLARTVEGGVTVTKSGLILGTPAYMSPEQAAGGTADSRSDVYSLGVLLFEIFSGRRPFTHKSAPDLFRAHLLTPAPELSSLVMVDAALNGTIDRALHKEPSARFADASEMLTALDAGRTSVTSVPLQQVDQSTKPAKAMAKPELQADPRYERQPQGAPAPRSPRTAILVGVAAVSLLAVALVAVALVTRTSEPEAASIPIPAAAAPVTALPASPVTSPTPPDRWADPGELAPMLARLQRGSALTRGQEQRLGMLIRRNEQDPRPALLLAHSYASQRNLTGALERYEQCLARDPTVAEEDWTRSDLITIATAEALHRKTTALILEHYDASDAEEVERRAAEERPPRRARLERVAAQLRGL